MAIQMTKPEHEVAYQDMVALINRHAGLSPIEILAIGANMLGKLVALQDQRVTTPAKAMETIARNLECGNQQVLAELTKNTAGNG